MTENKTIMVSAETYGLLYSAKQKVEEILEQPISFDKFLRVVMSLTVDWSELVKGELKDE